MSIPTYSLAEAKEDIKELDELIRLYVLLKATIQLHGDICTPEEQQEQDRIDLSLALAAIAQKGYDLTLRATANADK